MLYEIKIEYTFITQTADTAEERCRNRSCTHTSRHIPTSLLNILQTSAVRIFKISDEIDLIRNQSNYSKFVNTSLNVPYLLAYKSPRM